MIASSGNIIGRTHSLSPLTVVTHIGETLPVLTVLTSTDLAKFLLYLLYLYLVVKGIIISSGNLCSILCRSETGTELTCRVLDPGSLTVMLMLMCISPIDSICTEAG